MTQSHAPEKAKFTPRQKELLRLLNDGCTNRQMGEVLGISIHTIEVHMRQIFKKLSVSSRTQALCRWRMDQGPDLVVQVERLKLANAKLKSELEKRRAAEPARLPFYVSPGQMSAIQALKASYRHVIDPEVREGLRDLGLVYYVGRGRCGLTKVALAILKKQVLAAEVDHT